MNFIANEKKKVRSWALAHSRRAKAQLQTFLYMTIIMDTYLIMMLLLINFDLLTSKTS
jgi:hypothetical protein